MKNKTFTWKSKNVKGHWLNVRWVPEKKKVSSHLAYLEKVRKKRLIKRATDMIRFWQEELDYMMATYMEEK